MGERMRAHDWAGTPLGVLETWPQSLRSAVSICLNSRFPIAIYWGPDLALLYNDAWSPIPGKKHPWALGRPGREVWPEIWTEIGPLFQDVQRTGEGVWQQDQLLPMHRHGYTEECYFNFTFSPIHGEDGRVAGIFNAVIETTFHVIETRRARILRELAEHAAGARSTPEVCALAAEVLSAGDADVPFCLFYLREDGAPHLRLAAAAGAIPEEARPDSLDLADPASPWPAATVLSSARSEVIERLGERLGVELPSAAWPEPVESARVAPLAGLQGREPVGLLILGVSPRRALDEAYRTFFERVTMQVAASIGNAQAYEAERRRAEALAEIDRAKTAFFSNVSHEFRTPLTLILGPLEDALAEAGGAGSAHRERLEVAYRNSLRMLKLVNTLLDFSRIEAGRMQASYEPVDLAAFTAELASVFRSAAERAGQGLLVNCPPLDEPVYVDREMWEKIVLNLLSNAFKFTFEGEVEVSLRRAGEVVELAVRDTGTGIPLEELPRLFERFYRVQSVRGRSFEGSGIGLALVQELVKLHGGTVRVESQLDRGSTFTVAIPLGTAHLPADRIGAARTLASTGLRSEAYVQEALRWLPEDSSELRPALRLKKPEAGSSSPARILLADDNADMREYVRRLLDRDYEVVTVDDGAAALRAAREQPFDLVLSDVMMPHLDGFELLAGLRSDESTKTLPVILLSARAGEEAKLEGLAAGADDYLVKPFSARELLARVETHLRLQRVRREAQQALRASEEKFATAFGRSPLALTITAVDDGTFVEVNDGFVDLSGYTREEVLEHKPEELGLWTEPEVRAERFARLLAGERVPHIEARFHTKNGEERTGVIGSALVEINSRKCVLSSVTDITARKRAEEALREADRRKDEFLAMLAHELRNPLAPIRNAAQVLKLVGPAADAHQQWAREVIERQTQHLTRLVDDLLEVSRITRGKVTLAREPLDLSTVVHRAVETSRPLIDARRHTLKVTLPSETVRLEGDLTRLVQVVGNLLNNAAKYTNEGGHIWLEAAAEDGEAVLRVRDDGMGLSADLLPHVFDLFTQADRSLDRSQGGLGIGLTLVRQLVELHGGRVEARSDGPGQGSEFIVRLPAAAPPDTAESKGSAGEDTRPASYALKILVVEDNVDSAEMLSFVLKLGGHEVRMAHDGLAALETARDFQPQVVLCDIGLPGMNGYEVAQKLRAQPELQQTRFIALTGYGQEEDRRRAYTAGFDYHLVKPVEPETLGALLNSLRSAE